MDRGRIARPSTSEYASPVVLVKKKNGSTRLCVDYRELNKKIVKDRYPLPLIEDQLDRLQGATLFSVLDLKDGFIHVPIDENSCKYTAFIVLDGHFEFLRTPFGLCNSSAVFQRFINAVFRELISNGTVLTYMDDIVVPSHNLAEGIIRLQTVLSVARDYGLNINWAKCHFVKKRIEYLGHIVEDGRIRPSERKSLAVRTFPTPTSMRQVQSFLGLIGYFRKFIPQYSIIARPISNLLRDGVRFHFGDEQKSAFQRLKAVLSEDPVLVI